MPSLRGMSFTHTWHRGFFLLGYSGLEIQNVEYRTRNRRMMKCSLRHSIFLVRHSAVQKLFNIVHSLHCRCVRPVYLSDHEGRVSY
jgi:hypothetical protein